MTDTTDFDNITGMTGAGLQRWDICDEYNVTEMLNSVEKGTKMTIRNVTSTFEKMERKCIYLSSIKRISIERN